VLLRTVLCALNYFKKVALGTLVRESFSINPFKLFPFQCFTSYFLLQPVPNPFQITKRYVSKRRTFWMTLSIGELFASEMMIDDTFTIVYFPSCFQMQIFFFIPQLPSLLSAGRRTTFWFLGKYISL
jgi:hypothetical protein